MDYKRTEPIQISALLDIESLDTNLYRSKKAILPSKNRSAYILFNGVLSLTRGSVIDVFGGLVISHAMVAATKSVKPEFHLHVRQIPSVPSVCVLTLSHSRCM
jgi:acyl-CoA thioesterase